MSLFQRWRHDDDPSRDVGDLERRGVGDIIMLSVPEYGAPMAGSCRLSRGAEIRS